ncbi:MAG: S8 family serine peptidase [Chloroflexi bacterium]|nr:S8 family serine peptidase [Chloroflexota bacterium]
MLNDTTSKRKRMGLAAALTAILLIFIFTLAPAPADTAVAANVQPALLAMAAEQPDDNVRVIVYKAGADAALEGLVTELGGAIVKDLHLINALAVKLPAGAVPALARSDSVAQINLDGAVANASVFTETVRDEFSSTAYTNNNGSQNWAGDWLESGESDGPGSGDLRISSGILKIRDDNRSLRRAVDLSGATSATLSFDYRRYRLDRSSDYIAIEVSADGGASWTELDRFVGAATDSSYQFTSYDISGYATANTVIRFSASSSLGSYDYLYVDNLQIEFVTGSSSDPLIQEAEEATLYGNFTLGNDASASGGQYIHAPEGSGNFYGGLDSDHRAEFNFYVDTPGTYQIKGWLYTPDAGSDSFYYTVNGLPAIGTTWTTFIHTSFEVETIGEFHNDPYEIYLPTGNHTVTIYVRETGAALDKLELTLVEAIAGGGDGVSGSLIQEAEEATLYGNFTIGGDANASGGQYIYPPEGSGDFRGGLDSDHRAEFDFIVATPGTYQIKGWVYAPDVGSDSFWYKVDGLPVDGANWSMLPHTSFEAEYIGESSSPHEFYLTSGAHTFTLYVREAGAAIDKLELVLVEADLTPNYYLDTLNVQPVWDMGIQGQGVTIAVIDSGISLKDDFGDRILTRVVFNGEAQTYGDTFGHGTHVAGIIAGDGTTTNSLYKGIAPQANLIGLKVSDEDGMAYESDTVAALQWVFDNKDAYNIRVVNLSLNSTLEQSYNDSALNAAAEILWLNGIVVVASSGNSWGPHNTTNAAPANDPFIITVGASEEGGSSDRNNDWVAAFTQHGITQDGFRKPEVIAPGKDIISALAPNSWWQDEYPERMVTGDYFRISGTSMAAPMVSGAAALLLQAEPNLTPDQVKYRLMNTGSDIYFNGAYPYLDVYDLITTPTAESANADVIPHELLAKMALIAYWASENGGGENIDWANVDWDAVDWSSVNWGSVNWGSVNWGSVNWGSVNWGSVNWGSVNWGSVNWGSVNWGSVNWGSVNWGSVNWGSVNWGSVDFNE